MLAADGSTSPFLITDYIYYYYYYFIVIEIVLEAHKHIHTSKIENIFNLKTHKVNTQIK